MLPLVVLFFSRGITGTNQLPLKVTRLYIAGYYSISSYNNVCEISKLCVLPEYRKSGIGKRLLEHAFDTAEQLGCNEINISIIEENTRLKKRYENYGFKTAYTENYDFSRSPAVI